tara:strand:+ start:8698 stop:9381 length:684 start_codon:yes stop_codon:yes gene_type:complete
MKFLQLKINKHSYIYIVTLLLLIIVFSPFFPLIGIGLFFILLFIIYFFRDPDKIIPINENLILSPADGKVTFVDKEAPPKESQIIESNYKKISIFLNVFDIHINRIPVAGKILSINYISGKFFNATLDKSSKFNERNIIVLELKDRSKIIVVQIAGMIARRIVCDINNNQKVNAGDRFGLIKFGSRVDIYIPEHLNILVSEGQRVIGGETIIADLNNRVEIKSIVRK